ncbi:Transglutaminase-like superfamily protein [Cognatishimia activa]|uniref:Transglutaminase-like superfamily protein n=1 Tax=Cognatishimia activa TaxID=1715691 RepID=A0A0P1JDX3_9RHOB|nr:transglutaminase family protein [Cognatishimia activa]CUK27533.1 Transglutaminase-like superfamily protein [Cognatishimia activa]
MAETKRLTVRHATRYSYDVPVHYALQQLRLTPRDAIGQTVLQWKTTVTGGAKQLEFDDQFQNRTQLVKVETGATEVEFLSEGIVEVKDLAGVSGPHRGYAPLWLFLQPTERTKPGPAIRSLVSDMQKLRKDNDDVSVLHQTSAEILKTVAYRIGTTDSTTTAEQAMASGEGVCQDHAHIMITVARALGFPARYTSGYLLMDDRVDQDATHAWCEIHVTGLGWIGFDVSNGISPDARYISLATGRDYRDAAPILGIRQGDGQEALEVALQVQQ